jgi:acyl-CoA thioester hydrolase
VSDFRHRLRVRYSDCDPQGVVFNANYLTYFDIAITELWREAIGSYERIHEYGADLVVAEARVRYLAPIAFDEEIDLVATVDHMGTTSIVTAIGIEGGGELRAEGHVRHVVVAHGTSKKMSIPEPARAALEPFTAS